MYKVVFPLISLILTAACGTSVPAEGLVFDPSSGKAGSIELPTGETVNYTAYEKLYFVTNVEDPTYQYMNVYVPEGATRKTPIFLRTYVGGYMASEAAAPQAGDASGRALAEGYVVAIPGSRGRNSKVGETWTGSPGGHPGPQSGYPLPASFRQADAWRCRADHHRRHQRRRRDVSPDGRDGQLSGL